MSHLPHNATIVLAAILWVLPALAASESKESPQPAQDSSDAAAPVKKISLAEFEEMRADKGAVVLDVRTPDEFNAGHVPGAVHINWRARDFNEQVGKLDKAKKYLVYCLSGVRSANAGRRMSELGFTQLFDFGGGWSEYQKAGKPFDVAAAGDAAPAAGAVHAAHAAKEGDAPKHKLYRPDRLEWKDGPASLPPGAKVAVLEGDPAKEGYFALRLQLPDGYKIPAHWHPNVERVTVISGTFHLGMGEKLDPKTAEALPAGSYVFMEPGMRHFAWTEGPTVIQFTTVGPWAINYVNPSDDPRRKKQ